VTERIAAEPPALRTTKPHDIALGLERIGLVSLRFPLLATLILLAVCIGAAFGLTRLKVDDSLSQLFRSNNAEFKQYEEVSRRFPSSEFDVLVVVEGKALLERKKRAAENR